mgnify:CR=1 FL=1
MTTVIDTTLATKSPSLDMHAQHTLATEAFILVFRLTVHRGCFTGPLHLHSGVSDLHVHERFGYATMTLGMLAGHGSVEDAEGTGCWLTRFWRRRNTAMRRKRADGDSPVQLYSSN